jgi:hypothetical protein
LFTTGLCPWTISSYSPHVGENLKDAYRCEIILSKVKITDGLADNGLTERKTVTRLVLRALGVEDRGWIGTLSQRVRQITFKG